MAMNARIRVMFVTALLLSTAVPVWAGPAEKFSLSAYVPAESILSIHARTHDGKRFVLEQYERVWAALEKARLDRVLKTRIRDAVMADGTTTREQFEQDWLTINDLLAGVEWSKLLSNETAFAMKMGMPAEFLMLCRPEGESAEKSFEGLAAMLKKLAELTPDLAVKEVDEDGLHTCQIVVPAPFPLALTLAKHKDVLLFGFGSTLIEQSVALMTGEIEGTLASSERFTNAFNGLPPGEDEIMFIDMQRMFVQLRQLANMAEGAAPPDAPMNPTELANAVLDELDIFDTVAAVGTTKGMQKRMEAVARIQPDSEKKLLHATMFGNPPLEDPFRYIPANASGVNVNSGWNLRKLYDGVIEFVKTKVPDGEMQVQAFQQELEMQGIDPGAALLNWLQGGVSLFSVPGPTKFAPAEWVWLLALDDEAQAKVKVSEAMAFVKGQLGEQGQVNAIKIGEAEFNAIVQPMMAAFGLTPVIGVSDKKLVIGSSKRIIESSLSATEAEKTFAANERYKKEGLPLGKNVVAFRFEDTTQFGENTAQALQMVQMAAMFGGPELSKDPFLSTAIRMAGKLAPVVRELNFYQSTCAQATFDGRELRSVTLVNYREPPKPESSEAEEVEAKPASGN